MIYLFSNACNAYINNTEIPEIFMHKRFRRVFHVQSMYSKSYILHKTKLKIQRILDKGSFITPFTYCRLTFCNQWMSCFHWNKLYNLISFMRGEFAIYTFITSNTKCFKFFLIRGQ